MCTRSLLVRMGLTMFGRVALAIVVLYMSFSSHLNTLRDRSLSGQAADVARHLLPTVAGGMRVDLPPALVAAYQDGDRYRYAGLTGDGHLLTGSPDVAESLGPNARLGVGNA
ncbi:MAG: two-component system sensor histidine kinase TctE [Gammaproteobacteria bacterium]|jgi:two-component system sensor histidine kinase TctE